MLRQGRVSRSYRVHFAVVTCMVIGAGMCTIGGHAEEVVLLDEEWTAEIAHNNVQVQPVDIGAGGEETQCKRGTKAVLLENTQGWPNVRFSGAEQITLSAVVPGTTRVHLWYRTDAWDGKWQMQIYVYYGAAGRPVEVLRAMLDGGGEDGKLIADDEWHEATGTLYEAGEYDNAPKNDPLPTYVWLQPQSGWNKTHRTFVDYVSLTTPEGAAAEQKPEQRAASQPPVEVEPQPGRQTNGPTWVWWEAEDAMEHGFPAGGAFAPDNRQQQNKLSNGAWLQHHNSGGVTGEWRIDVPQEGEYSFWTRKFWKHGPFRWRWNEGEWHTCGRDISLADNVSLRTHLGANWVYLGQVELAAGENTLRIEVFPEAGAAAFDCWLLSKGPFIPDGANKPGSKYDRAEEGWFAFEPDPDAFTQEAAFDLRGLNQERAGEDGFVRARGREFVFGNSGEPVQFWAVNASCDFDDPASVRYLARRLAKLGVNMIRIHGRVFDPGADDLSTIDTRRLDQMHRTVAAMAEEGIYTEISLYFPLWVSMRDEYGFPGYEEGEHPFALLFFNSRFQEIYRSWVREVMTTENPYTGMSFAEDPAVAIIEVTNEDNFLFWTFKPGENPPKEVLGPLERAFGEWLIGKYGSLEGAVDAWGDEGNMPQGDDFANGRVALYSAGMLTGADWARAGRNEQRASDQLQFLTEYLRGFYADMVDYFRNELGIKCAITATNWKTADPRVLEPLDKYTNMACDVIDRHEYFGGPHTGEGSSYSVRTGHDYADRTGLYEPTGLTRELQYGAHPHTVSEHNYPMPNRYRAECPWLAATYGRLCGTDAYFHFALGTADWLRQHPKFSIYTPVFMGQFPGLALAYRMGYVSEGPAVVQSAVQLEDLYGFEGTPVPQQQNLDQLRQADVPPGQEMETPAPATIDPLAYYVGQVQMTFPEGEEPAVSKVMNLSEYIDRDAKRVVSATGELAWDWGQGVVTLNAERAQGACGFLADAGTITLQDITIDSQNEYGTVIVASLDGRALADSERMLLQVMTEDRNYGWQTVPAEVDGQEGKRITNIGAPPIVVKEIAGALRFDRADAAELDVIALDHNGYRREELAGGADSIELLSDCLYYVITTR